MFDAPRDDNECSRCGGLDPACPDCSNVVHEWDEVLIDGSGSGFYLCNAVHHGEPCDQTRADADVDA